MYTSNKNFQISNIYTCKLTYEVTEITKVQKCSVISDDMIKVKELHKKRDPSARAFV